MTRRQNTIASAVEIQGVGLHSGLRTTVSLQPSTINRGRYFVIDGVEIPAHGQAVAATMLSTELRHQERSVRTVEHLLAALVGLQIDNVAIGLDQPELPILDGSALPWVEAIATVGVAEQQAELEQPLIIEEPLTVHRGDSFVTAMPSPCLRFTYGIEFTSRAIAQQWFSWCPVQFREEFITEIAPARTFTMAHEVDYLRSQGLIKGGSLENAIVCDQEKWLNPPLRFENEPCRHKLLDLIGDLSLAGSLPQAHIIAFKASHSLHTQFAQALLDIVLSQWKIIVLGCGDPFTPFNLVYFYSGKRVSKWKLA